MQHVTIKTILFAVGFGAWGMTTAGGLGNIAPQPPMIMKTAVDEKENVLIISGRNFGSTSPSVSLADQTLDVKRFSDDEVVASLPQDFASATYGVTVTTGGRNRVSSNLFSATLPDKK